ncbi:MAG: DNA polymerase III subunit delta' [Pseudomonadota bacterium]
MLFDEEFDEPASQPFIEGLKEPRDSNLLIGHDEIEQKLLKLVEGNNLPHALIFAGPKGVGKATFAYRLTRFLFSKGIEDDSQDSLFGDTAPKGAAENLDTDVNDPVFAKVSSGGHPDLLTIEKSYDPRTKKEKKGIDVETARKVAPFLRMTSSEGGWRIVIIDNADTMNNNAQNALLKILEEPPKNSLLILIAHRPSAMIPTIRSRCRTIAFSSLAEEHFNTLLSKEYGDEFSTEEKQLLLHLSNRQFGQTKNIIENDGLENIQTILRFFDNYPNFKIKDIHHLAETVGRAGQEKLFDIIGLFFDLYFAEVIMAKAKNKPLDPLFQNTLSQALSDKQLQTLLETQEKIRELFSQTVPANLDKRICIINVFSALKN